MTDPTETNEPIPECWIQCENVLADPNIRAVYIGGPPGIGKTWAAYHAGGARASDAFAITLTEETTAIELRGHYLPKGTDTVWHSGPLALAVENDTRAVLNEFSHGNADVQALCYPLFEDGATARMILPTGDVLKCGPGFHVVLTDNYEPDALPEALRDRMHFIWIDEPHPGALKLIHPELRESARRAVKMTDENATGLRGWIHVTNAAPRYGLEYAFTLSFGREKGPMLFDAARMNGCSWDPKATV